MSSSTYLGGVGGGTARDYGDYFVLPAAPAQRQLWFLCQLDEANNAAYNVTSAVRLAGRLNRMVLQRALNEVVARHESLRTGIGLVEGDPSQLVLPEALVTLPSVDRSGLEPVAAARAVRELAREQAAIPFTLDEPPLVRVLLVREAVEVHTLVVVVHHVVCDGWSTEIFYRDLADAYRRLSISDDHRPADLPIQYADYVAWQESELAGDGLRDLAAHWRSTLAGTAPLALPTDRARAGGRRMAGGRVESTLDHTATAALDALAESSDATLFMLLLTGWTVTLSRVTGQDDVAVGTPVAGRHHPDAEELIGFFANTLVLRTRLTAAGSFGDAVAAVRHTCLEAFSHQRMPFDRLVEEVGQARALDRNPLFDVMFSMQNTPAVTVTLPDLTMTPVELDTTAAKFDLWLTVLPATDGITLRLEYDSDLYAEDTAAGLLALYRSVLDEAVRAPETGIAVLPTATPADLALLDDWASGPQWTLPVETVPALLAAGTAAVSAPDGELTATDLADRAAALADRLRAEGIAGPGAVVSTPPIASTALVVVVVAVFRVGAAIATGNRHRRDGAFVAKDGDGWSITTGPRFDPVTDSAPPIGDDPASVPAPGVAHRHRDVVAAVAAVADRLGLGHTDEVLLVPSATTDPVDLLAALTTAGRLTLSEEPAGDDAAATVVMAAPPRWRRLLTDGWTPPDGARLVCRGEVVATDLAEQLVRTGRTVYIGRTTSATPLPVDLATPGRHSGAPLAGISRRLLDPTGAPVPVGVVGELHLNATPTGERYRHTRAGGLEFLGHDDERVAAGDHLVRPSRIEQVMAGVEGVLAAAVVADDARLVCWLVAERDGTARERDELLATARAVARRALAEHEVPAMFGLLPELPRRSDGTVDRAALGALPGQGALDQTPPRNRDEQVVVALFRDLLPVREFGVHADFFALGGHSLLAAKVIGRVHEQLGVVVPVRDFFRRATAAGLAEAVAALRRDPAPADRGDAVAGGLAGMSDTEVEQLLRQLA